MSDGDDNGDADANVDGDGGDRMLVQNTSN